MMKKKYFVSFICVIVLLVACPYSGYATEDDDFFGAGELEQDNSGVIEEGDGETLREDPKEEEPEEPKPREKTYLEIKSEEIFSAQQQKKTLESGLSDVKQIKEELEKSRYDLNQYVTKLDSNLGQIEDKIYGLNTLIAEKQEAIEAAKTELQKAQEAEREQYASMKRRIKFMYQRGNVTLLDILFGSGSFSELLNKVEYIQRLTAYDRQKMEEYQETMEYVRLCEEELLVQQETLEAAASAAAQEQSAVEELIVQKQEEIEDYESDISKKDELIAEYEVYITEQNNTIAALELAVAAEKKRLAEQGGGSAIKYSGGSFAWPAPGYTRISDDYGYRMHPILQVEKFHNGVDMAAPSGSLILAAYDGQVVAADYNASMGNYIMIDHGDALYTVYMHCSAINVTTGQIVTKGETIGAVGSTGRSTGPHLHFSVRLNGNYVNPWNYL